MAQIVLIKTKTDTQEVGDVVMIREDDFKFGQEKVVFNIIKVDGDRASLELLNNVATPKTVTLYKTGVTGWSDKPYERKEVWKDGKEYKDIVVRPRHTTKWDGEKFVHNYSRDVLNATKVPVDKVIVAEVEAK